MKNNKAILFQNESKMIEVFLARREGKSLLQKQRFLRLKSGLAGILLYYNEQMDKGQTRYYWNTYQASST